MNDLNGFSRRLEARNKVSMLLIYLVSIIIVLKHSLYDSLYGYDSNGHILVSNYIISNFHFPNLSMWKELSGPGAVFPLFNSFLSTISIITGISAYNVGKFIFPLLSFTIIFLLVCLILTSIKEKSIPFWVQLLILFFIFVSPKVLKWLSYSVRPEILGVILILLFKYTYIKYLKGYDHKFLSIAIVTGLVTVLIHYLAGLFLVSSFLIYGLFFGDRSIGKHKMLNEFVIALFLFAFFWGGALFTRGVIYRGLSIVLGISYSWIHVLFVFFVTILVISLLRMFINNKIDNFIIYLDVIRKRLANYQIVFVLFMVIAVFFFVKMFSAIDDIIPLLALNIHWIVFIPLSISYLLFNFLNKNEEKHISLLSCFMAFSYIFSFVFLLGVSSGVFYGVWGKAGSAWVIRFINYTFLEMSLIGIIFIWSIRKSITPNLERLNIPVKSLLIISVVLSNIFVAACYVDETGDKPPMHASKAMLFAEKYIFQDLRLEQTFESNFLLFVYNGLDFNETLNVKRTLDLNQLVEKIDRNKKLGNKDIVILIDKHRLTKYGRMSTADEVVDRYKLAKVMGSSLSEKIYLNNDVFVLRIKNNYY